MAAPIDAARKAIAKLGSTFRTSEALSAGIHPRTLYSLRDAGELELLSRGVYRLASLEPLRDPDLATVAKRIPQGVVCLISALALHELTTQVPHEVHLALGRTARTPSFEYPPLRVYRFSAEAFTAGVETIWLDDVPVRVYGPEKSLADAFKFRNKIGLDVALEALKMYTQRRRPQLQRVLEFARVCRVEKILRPYLEACT
jgi:predicted transcriptional regulator of viral defense system